MKKFMNYTAPILFSIGSILSFIYYFMIMDSVSSELWILIGLGLLGLSVLWLFLNGHKKTKISIFTIVFLMGGVLLSNTARIVINLNGNPQNNLDYIIVLGGQVFGEELSPVLKSRCDTALDSIMINKDAIIVVSGGQGNGELISEAEAMKRYFVLNGIDENRILLETRSTNTIENITFSTEIIKQHAKDYSVLNVGVVSNDFHLKRARYLLYRNGTEYISCISTATSKLYLPHYVLRETMALTKDYLYYVFK